MCRVSCDTPVRESPIHNWVPVLRAIVSVKMLL